MLLSSTQFLSIFNITDASARGAAIMTLEGRMPRSIYEVVEHDGGWAYRVGGVYSETFASHDHARQAAERAAREQEVPGETTDISYEDKDGVWHEEASPGIDRPETSVDDDAAR